jgi:hypothetical protein
VPVSRKRRRKLGNAPDLRGYLRKRLRGIQTRLIARVGAVGEVFQRAYVLDRLDHLEAGKPVGVIGYEISDVVPQIGRDTVYTIDERGRLLGVGRDAG